jgi:hypothetical protein
MTYLILYEISRNESFGLKRFDDDSELLFLARETSIRIPRLLMNFMIHARDGKMCSDWSA